jgi:hypothetical protein
MTLVMLRPWWCWGQAPQEEGSCLADVVCSYNSTVETFVQQQRSCQVFAVAQRRHKKDAMLRHPVDGSQWRKIEREFPNFADDARNLRFGLSTDVMNPFGEQSCSHCTWHVTLCIYNVPPWLCMKWKFIMMPLLIQGPKQPNIDINVYLRPLVEELL